MSLLFSCFLIIIILRLWVCICGMCTFCEEKDKTLYYGLVFIIVSYIDGI